MRVLRCLVLFGLVVMTLSPARMVAQPASATDKAHVAKQYVDAGLAAQNSGDYDTAITLYEKAYQLVPHPVLLFNLAQAHRLAGRIDEALALYARFLAKDPNGAQARIARDLVTELEARKAQQARRAKEARKSEAARKARAGRSDAEDKALPEDRAVTNEGDERAGDSEAGGTLIVHARSQRGVAIRDGTVLVDDQPRGSVARGKLTVPGIAEGRHTVAIEAEGYRRFEDTVTVHDDEPARLDALLVETIAPSPPQPFPLWKVSLGTSLSVAAAGSAFSVYSNDRMEHHKGTFATAIDPNTGMTYTAGVTAPDQSDCGRSDQELAATKHAVVTDKADFLRGCTWRSRVYLGYFVTGASLVGAVVSLIMLARDAGSSAPTSTGVRHKTVNVSIAPVITSDGGGASLSLTW